MNQTKPLTIMKLNFLFLIPAVIALSITFPGHAQQNSGSRITGKVYDEKHQALAYAAIELLKAADSAIVKGTLSSDSGTYVFDNIPEGAYLVSVDMTGYEKIIRGPFTLTASRQEYTVNEVQLNAKVKQLKEISVVAQRPLVEHKIDRTVLNIENSTLATGNNALDILARSPGVTVTQNGDISMRGKQGVSVMIDGKLTYLSGDELAGLLRSMQGSAIQFIELITNPSAKYDAAGTAGIINIKLKKNKNYGTNGIVTVGAGIGRYPKDNVDISLNHREKRINLYGNYNYSYNKRFRDLNIERTNRSGTEQTYFDQRNKVDIIDRNNTYKAGIDYFINKNNTLGFMVNGSNRRGSDQTASTTLIGGMPGKIDSSLLANNPAKRKLDNIIYNLTFKSVLDSMGQELDIDADYVQYNNRLDNNYNNAYLNNGGTQLGDSLVFRSTAPSTVKIWAGKIDYTWPIDPKTKLDAGLKSSFVRTDNNINFDNFYSGSWKSDPSKSNSFVYDEYINAAYVNVNHAFKNSAVQAGLRAEQTNSKGNSITTQKIVNRHYLNLFPSVFYSQKLSANHEIGFSYSRRIDRPNYADLNPFVYNFDLYTLAAGNPFLNAQYTDAFEMTYSYKKTLNFSLGYSRTNNAITEVTLPDTINKTLYVQKQNLAKQDYYYFNVNSPLNITNWWHTENNLNIFYNKFSAPSLVGSPFSSGKTSVSFNSYQSFTINPSTSIDLSFLYVSPSAHGTYSARTFCWADMGIKKMFLKNKASLKIAVDDIFNTHRERIQSVIPGQDYRIYQKYETRVARITFSYRFGSKDIKEARQRARGSATEENRVGN